MRCTRSGRCCRPNSPPSVRRLRGAERVRDDVDLDRTAAYLQTAATPADAEGFRAAAGLALACLDAIAQELKN